LNFGTTAELEEEEEEEEEGCCGICCEEFCSNWMELGNKKKF
jgi:hypothetical protein